MSRIGIDRRGRMTVPAVNPRDGFHRGSGRQKTKSGAAAGYKEEMDADRNAYFFKHEMKLYFNNT